MLNQLIKLSVLFLLITSISINLFAHDKDKKQLKPYVVVLGPNNLSEIRVNFENYEPNNKEIKKSVVNFGDGTVVNNNIASSTN